MKLSAYARKTGISYETAYRWFRDGRIQNAYQTSTGTILVPDTTDSQQHQRTKTVIYARVSSNEQRTTTLESQAERMEQFAIANGWIVDEVVKEVGSGLNDTRRKLVTILEDPEVRRIIVEHRDRLTRFGYHYIEMMGQALGFEIIVANKTMDHDKNDIMADFTAIITSFCQRLYSQRRSTHKQQKIEAIITEK